HTCCHLTGISLSLSLSLSLSVSHFLSLSLTPALLFCYSISPCFCLPSVTQLLMHNQTMPDDWVFSTSLLLMLPHSGLQLMQCLQRQAGYSIHIWDNIVCIWFCVLCGIVLFCMLI